MGRFGTCLDRESMYQRPVYRELGHSRLLGSDYMFPVELCCTAPYSGDLTIDQSVLLLAVVMEYCCRLSRPII